jgi:hypothetical protein
VRYSASPFNFQHPVIFFRASTSCLRLLLRHSITSIFPSTMLFRSQFQSKPTLLFLVHKSFFFSLTLCATPSFITINTFVFTSQNYSHNYRNRYLWTRLRHTACERVNTALRSEITQRVHKVVNPRIPEFSVSPLLKFRILQYFFGRYSSCLMWNCYNSIRPVLFQYFSTLYIGCRDAESFPPSLVRYKTLFVLSVFWPSVTMRFRISVVVSKYLVWTDMASGI